MLAVEFTTREANVCFMSCKVRQTFLMIIYRSQAIGG